VITIKTFVFNPFQENTYLLYDETGEAAIVDAGCSNDFERRSLLSFIDANKLKPKRLINTHGHVDHLLGVASMSKFFNLPLEIHHKESDLIKLAPAQAQMFGLQYEPLSENINYFSESDCILFGTSNLEIRFVPGHSSGSVAFYSQPDNFIITGDVLFNGSIGRTDLPGGSFDILMHSIKTQLLTLNDNVMVFPGHGPYTHIGTEREQNPFL
jgi:glyoxylase-like metal-dependent hydrolase (beta-lactamase superfamily II)